MNEKLSLAEPVIRNAKGQWIKGVKPPGAGRKPLPASLREMCQALAPKAIATAQELMEDPKTPGNVRMMAINTILDRAYGKAPQAVTVNYNEMSRDDLLRRAAGIADRIRAIRASVETSGCGDTDE